MSLQTELQAILTTAAIAPVTDRAFLRITGPDATRWLNGMVTNNIKDLRPGQGNYNFLLNAQGRILGDCAIYREPGDGEPAFLLTTQTSHLTSVSQTLDKFIIMDDVELSHGIKIEASRIEETPRGLALMGPLAGEIVLKTIEPTYPLVEPFKFDLPKPGTTKHATLEGHEVIIVAPPSPPVPTYEVWCSDTSQIKELYRVWEFYDATPVSPAALEAYRILTGIPRYGTDIRNTDTARDLPQETALNGGQSHALNFNKGCYLGQEIVERIHSRGQVHRTFTRFQLTGDLPTVPTPLTLESDPAGKQVGELTSAAEIPLASGTTLRALGYIRREAATATLAYPGGTATVL